MLISLNGLKSVSESTMWLLHRCALDWMQQSAALTYAHSSHYATDVTCFQGVCSWTVDCRNVHQSCSLLTTCSFYYKWVISNVISENVAVHLTGHTSIDHKEPHQPRTSTSSYVIWDQPPGQLMQFQYKLSNSVPGKLICTLHVLIRVLNQWWLSL